MRNKMLVFACVLCVSLLSACAQQAALPAPTNDAALSAPVVSAAVTPLMQTAVQRTEVPPSPTPAQTVAHAQTEAPASHTPAQTEAPAQTQEQPVQPQGEQPTETEATDAMLEEKKALQDVVIALESLTPGQDYIEDTVMALVPDQATAETVAAQYHITLLRFQNNLAIYQTDVPVLELIQLAADTSNDLYPLYPDYLNSIS